MAKKSGSSKTTLRFRDAKTGQFLTDKQGQKRSSKTVVRDRIPKPGYGDTSNVAKTSGRTKSGGPRRPKASSK